MTIHHSAWQDAAWPETVDCIITDPPYSARTHTGNDGGRRVSNRKTGAGNVTENCREIDYAALTPDEAHAWGREWARRARSWVAVLTDSELMHAWRSGFEAGGMTTFAPVPCVIIGMTCRLAGDGPSSWAVYLMVARSKAASKWGTLPGAYVVNPMNGNLRAQDRIGGKPLPLMRQIVRDYSRPGMVVADPCCGYGTTLIAAAEQGRTVWGCDTDAESVKRTRERLETVKAQPQLFENPLQLEIT
jgi:site-specific DNA-methyltransferase (adenine-specific)